MSRLDKWWDIQQAKGESPIIPLQEWPDIDLPPVQCLIEKNGNLKEHIMEPVTYRPRFKDCDYSIASTACITYWNTVATCSVGNAYNVMPYEDYIKCNYPPVYETFIDDIRKTIKWFKQLFIKMNKDYTRLEPKDLQMQKDKLLVEILYERKINSNEVQKVKRGRKPKTPPVVTQEYSSFKVVKVHNIGTRTWSAFRNYNRVKVGDILVAELNRWHTCDEQVALLVGDTRYFIMDYFDINAKIK